MIQIKISKDNNIIKEISIQGHSGYADYGYDIVCSAVSALTIGIVNGITDVLKEKNLIVNHSDDDFYISTRRITDPELIRITQYFLETLLLAYQDIAEDYPDNLKVLIN